MRLPPMRLEFLKRHTGLPEDAGQGSGINIAVHGDGDPGSPFPQLDVTSPLVSNNKTRSFQGSDGFVAGDVPGELHAGSRTEIEGSS